MVWWSIKYEVLGSDLIYGRGSHYWTLPGSIALPTALHNVKSPLLSECSSKEKPQRKSSCWIQLVLPTFQLHVFRQQKHGQKSHGWGQLGMLRWQEHLGRYILPGYPSPRARAAQPRTTWHVSWQLCQRSDLFFSERPSQALKLKASSAPLLWFTPDTSPLHHLCSPKWGILWIDFWASPSTTGDGSPGCAGCRPCLRPVPGSFPQPCRGLWALLGVCVLFQRIKPPKEGRERGPNSGSSGPAAPRGRNNMAPRPMGHARHRPALRCHLAAAAAHCTHPRSLPKTP